VAVGKVKPASLSFQKRDAGTESSAKTVILKNIGSAALSVANVATSAGFTQTNTCTTALAPGESCDISVKFAPSVTGEIAGSLTIDDNATNSPQVVSLSGKGLAAK